MSIFRSKKSPPPIAKCNPYDEGWSSYSERWDLTVKKDGMEYLGDEWGSKRLTEAIVQEFVIPFLNPQGTALEIGSGGGKYSEKLAALYHRLVCSDVSEKMLSRTRARLARAENVGYELLSGYDLRQFRDATFDYVFSFDVFVHIEMEDVYSYLREIHRVLKPSGRGLLHFANLNSPEGWEHFITDVPHNLGRTKNFDRFRFLTWEIVEKFLRSLDFEILTLKKEPWRDILVVFEKPGR